MGKSKKSKNKGTFINYRIILILVIASVLIFGLFNLKLDNSRGVPPTTQKQTAPTITPTQFPAEQKDLTGIVSEWSPYVVLVTCYWGNVPMPKNLSYYQRGSSIIVDFNGEINLITNRHVLENIGYGSPNKCLISNSTDHYYEVKNPKSYFANDNNVDAARVIISYQNYTDSVEKQYYDQNYSYFENLSKSSPIKSTEKLCDVSQIGTQIAILGYPYTGGERGTNITVTEGIISGLDGGGYVTSAKIEHGNSGGVAISTKNDCYLGIPTSVAAGELESLGRILKWQTIFEK